jgi:hypothetical protein
MEFWFLFWSPEFGFWEKEKIVIFRADLRQPKFSLFRPRKIPFERGYFFAPPFMNDEILFFPNMEYNNKLKKAQVKE